MGLSKEAILAADDLPREKVSVPEWGGDVWVRTMTGGERDSWEAAILSGDKVDLLRVRSELLVRTICDENGVRLFADNEAASLAKKSARALSRLTPVAQRLNGVSRKDQEELAGNSGGVQSGGSGSN